MHKLKQRNSWPWSLIISALLLLVSSSCSSKQIVKSPDQGLQISFHLNDGVPYYSLLKDGKEIISDSRLGFELNNQISLAENFTILKVEKFANDQTWSQPWGEVKNIRDHHNGLSITLQETTELARILKITFKVFNDGIGFRYEFPEQPNLKDFEITNELTEFNLNTDPTAWWIPAYSEAADYESLFSKNQLSEVPEQIHTPLTLESGDSLFLSIHEAALIDFPAMTLMPKGHSLQADLVPWSTGIKAKVTTPFKTPWRTIQVAKSAGDLITSYLILNLNEPNKLQDVSWIKPGKYNGIWWGMHIDKQTWGSGPKHGASTENVKAVIDFASENNLSGVLVEGWNEGWDNDWSGGMFNFTKPYADFDIEELTRYAAAKGVGLIGHHETGGNVNNYEKQLPEAFEYYQSLGIHTVKTGYVAKMPNGKEFHQGQFMVRHYNKVMQMAAERQIMVDMHEPVKATGLRRTYPNMMTREGARGTEYEAWSEGNPPEHTVILPFTRGLSGPLDYTPGIFDILIPSRPENRVHTTLAKQLALYVTLYSPLQMAADLPENYEGQPAFQFIRDVPTDWEVTKVLNAKIGDYLTIVRKDRNSDDWYLGSTTDESARDFKVSLDFLMPNKRYLAQIYEDGPDADMEQNPLSIKILEQTVMANQSLKIYLAAGGGQAIRFHLID